MKAFLFFLALEGIGFVTLTGLALIGCWLNPSPNSLSIGDWFYLHNGDLPGILITAIPGFALAGWLVATVLAEIFLSNDD